MVTEIKPNRTTVPEVKPPERPGPFFHETPTETNRGPVSTNWKGRR